MPHNVDPDVARFSPPQPEVISLNELLARSTPQVPVEPAHSEPVAATSEQPGVVREIGGRKDGLDPTRYGDWEKNGRCIDF